MGATPPRTRAGRRLGVEGRGRPPARIALKSEDEKYSPRGLGMHGTVRRAAHKSRLAFLTTALSASRKILGPAADRGAGRWPQAGRGASPAPFAGRKDRQAPVPAARLRGQLSVPARRVEAKARSRPPDRPRSMTELRDLPFAFAHKRWSAHSLKRRGGSNAGAAVARPVRRPVLPGNVHPPLAAPRRPWRGQSRTAPPELCTGSSAGKGLLLLGSECEGCRGLFHAAAFFPIRLAGWRSINVFQAVTPCAARAKFVEVRQSRCILKRGGGPYQSRSFGPSEGPTALQCRTSVRARTVQHQSPAHTGGRGPKPRVIRARSGWRRDRSGGRRVRRIKDQFVTEAYHRTGICRSSVCACQNNFPW